uniref:Peptidase M20 dimerisation domain-containing protein n=1 Tax=Sus scrofa TaxID=9823 RepID=A0A8D1K7X7_PIG
MARPYICLLALAAVLLLGIATISRSRGLRDKAHQSAPRIPSQFSQEERVAMKEALKGEPGSPSPTYSQIQVPSSLSLFFIPLLLVFPTVFKTSFIRHEVVGEYSHLFTVHGSDPSLQPYMLLAHIDVVPAPDEGWDVPPFSGLERNGFIYGRGTIDNKNSLMGILQALELLLIRNYIPRRSFFIALGHDEEVMGVNGAQKISALLQARGVQLAFIVDEGSFIFDGFIPGLKNPFAMVAVSQKGLINLMLQVNTTPGHSSAPPKETSIGILAAAVNRPEPSPPAAWSVHQTHNAVSLHLNGVLVNVIPAVAQAIVNFRIHPAQTVQEVLKLAKDIVADDRVQFHVLNAFDPPPISPYDDQALGYQLLRQTIQSVFPEINIVVPGTCVGNTDSRHYSNLTTGIYLFNPLYLQPQSFRLRLQSWQLPVSEIQTHLRSKRAWNQ